MLKIYNGDYGGGNPWGFGDEPDYGGNGGGMPDDFYDGLNGEWIIVDGVPTFEIALEGSVDETEKIAR